MFLPVLKGTTTDRDGCLCETCFFRLPDDIHFQLVNNSFNHANPEYNTIIIQALQNTRRFLDLNEDYYLLSDVGLKYVFERFTTRKELNFAAKKYTKSGIKVFEKFDHGKIIVTKRNIKKVLDSVPCLL